MLPKAYDPQGTEDRIYQMWEDSGAFVADRDSGKETFTVSMPLPNATGQLHLGHAVMLSLQDIFTRFNRMRGKEALWVPGTDHAAIATENVVIKKIQDEEGIADPREHYGREETLKKIVAFVDQSQGTIRGQIRKMGSSCDWSREAYTMDQPRHRCVYETFVKMFEAGLIYRGDRIVNWDPKLKTNVSDDEVEYVEKTDPFYWFQYGPFQIGTVRPETKFGDKYVVMHPDDERYMDYKHGDTFECEWINGKVTATIIKDEVVDPEFGSGCMTITPWHDHTDFELAERHGLDKQQIIDFDGTLLDCAGEFAGMHIDEARPKLIEHLDKKGLIVKVDENYQHAVATNSRGGGMIEPQIRLQWFIDVNKEAVQWKGKTVSLKTAMQDVVHSGDVNIIPERFNKIYFHWIDNLRDWCISRQIWWGHRIPVWYDEEGKTYLQKPQTLIFARHGESTGNRDKVAQGQDDPLTKKGEDHAHKLMEHLHDQPITKVISSGSVRAKHTAQVVADHFTLPVEVWDELNGYDFGEVVGTPEVEGKMNIERALEEKTGETLEEFYNRSKKAWDRLQKEQSHGDILVVSHRTNLLAIDVIRDGGKSEDILAVRRENEDADYGLWGKCVVPEELAEKKLQQDPDTLDTWFSSALWTWSTLMDPEATADYSLSFEEILQKSPDFQKFHPTQVMETGYDILFFWVARMILMTSFMIGDIPFHTVYLHGMVRTRDGKKMSKSNPETCIDPLEIIPEYGADALRLSMIVGQSPGNDFRLYEEKIAGYRNFINKLWNASRFVLMQCEDAGEDPHQLTLDANAELSLADRALLSALQDLIADVTDGLEKYRLSEVGERLYSFTWDFYCDWYLEISKGEANHAVLVHAMRTLLTLLHPYCPFVTEELWDSFKPEGADMLLKLEWPQVDEKLRDAQAMADFNLVIEVISAVRKLRTEQGLEPGQKVDVIVHTTDHLELLQNEAEHIKRLARLENLTIDDKPQSHEHAASLHLAGVDVFLPLEGLIDIEAEKAKLSKEQAKLTDFVASLEKKLGDKKFTDNAPDEVVEKEQQKLADNQEKLKKIEERLQALA